MNRMALDESHNSWRVLKLSCALVLAFASSGAIAASKLQDVIALLSEAKAKTEGRASRVQGCLAKRNPKLLAALISQYDDARNPFNGRIEGWIVEFRSQRSKTPEESLDLQQFNQALNRIDTFAAAADATLVKYSCPVFKKVIWGKVAAILLTPEMIKAVWDYFKDSSLSEKEREGIIRAIEVQKILEWQDVRAVIAFDWSTAHFFTASQITPDVLYKGSTSLYVNEWALAAKPLDKFTINKSLPLGLSSSYQLYTGSLKDMSHFTNGKP